MPTIHQSVVRNDPPRNDILGEHQTSCRVYWEPLVVVEQKPDFAMYQELPNSAIGIRLLIETYP
jgi:hypothetical protein